MIPGVPRPCVECGVLVPNGSRCSAHEINLYRGDYARRSKAVRDTATRCWLCGDGVRANDPWTADHVRPGDPASPLASAHRSCNSRRGDGARR